MASLNDLTGYGPRSRQRNNIYFDGDERRYELWETKFLGYMKIRGLNEVFKHLDLDNQEHDIDPDKSEEAYAELVQYLDDRSLSLIIRDAPNDGRRALQILRTHYRPKGMSRIICLYNELTSLNNHQGESITDYIIRAETAANSLKQAGENISDSLLIAMVLKGLPAKYEPFTTVITQRDKSQTFGEFKESLRNQEDSTFSALSESSVLKITSNHKHHKPPQRSVHYDQQPSNSAPSRWCTECKSKSHDTKYCRNKKRWCHHCQTKTHDTFQCRKANTGTNRSSAKALDHESDFKTESNPNTKHFSFFIDHNHDENHCTPTTANSALLVDSGASTHIINDKNKFVKFNSTFNPANHVIELADGRRINNMAEGQGDAIISLCDTNGFDHEVRLKNALYVPNFSQDIFSVPAAISSGHDSPTISFNKTCAMLTCSDTKFEIEKRGNLYYLCSSSSTSHNANHLCETASHTLEDWHEILGHCNIQDVLSLEKCVEGMNIVKPQNANSQDKPSCETCLLGKMTQSRNRTPDVRSKTILEKVHVDLSGPIDPMCKDNYQYAMCVVDDYSGLINVYFLKKKSDACLAFKKFLSEIAPYGTVKCVRSDGGGEFVSNEFKSLLIENKIKHETSSPHSPHQNGTAERSWRSLFEMARCLLISAKLPKYLWNFAVSYAAFIRNRCFNHRLRCTPFQAFTGLKPNISKLQRFGSICYALVQNPKKLQDRSEKGIFLGFDKGSPAYSVYFPNTRQVKKIRIVKFENSSKPRHQIEPKQGNDDEYEHDLSFPLPVPKEKSVPNRSMNTTNPITNQELENSLDETNQSDNAIDQTQIETGEISKRESKKPSYLNDYFIDDEIDHFLNVTTHYCYVIDDVPCTYKDAVSCSSADKWQNAMHDEIQNLHENDTFELTPLPPGREAVGGKWVYAIKTDQFGNKTHKARFVAKGYSQIEGIDYHETFSPTTRMSSIRLFTQLAVQNDFEIHQMDVKSAFLNAPIDCEIYVQQPKGFETKTKNNEKLVLKLNKSLYGLKQSGRNWNNVLDNYLTNNGFIKSINDPCFYYLPNNEMYLLVWVDDILIASKPSSLKSVKMALEKNFKMKDLGIVSYFLGMEFDTTNSNEISISQSLYISKLLERFGMNDCKARYTPSELKLCKHDADCMLLNDQEMNIYKQIVGALIYIMTATRPDIAYTVTNLSQHMHCARKCHMTMAKHALRYLKGTQNEKLIFTKSGPFKITGFCDADWANSNDRKSVTGYCFRISSTGPMISWKSRKQPTVALSTCEAEYMSLVSAAQEGKYLTSILNEVTNMKHVTFNLFCDNQGAVALAKNPVKHQRSKHVDIKYHFVRDEIMNNNMTLSYIPTDSNIADLFTKPASSIKLQGFMKELMG